MVYGGAIRRSINFLAQPRSNKLGPPSVLTVFRPSEANLTFHAVFGKAKDSIGPSAHDQEKVFWSRLLKISTQPNKRILTV